MTELIALLSLVLLIAFKTKRVRELFFRLLRDDLTRTQFDALVRRAVPILLVVLLFTASMAFLGQLLSPILKSPSPSRDSPPPRSDLKNWGEDSQGKDHEEKRQQMMPPSDRKPGPRGGTAGLQ